MRAVAQQFGSRILETPTAFYMQVPNPVSGACPAGTRPVYRFFKPAALNHRFPAEQTVASELNDTAGWIAEGFGPGSAAAVDVLPPRELTISPPRRANAPRGDRTSPGQKA